MKRILTFALTLACIACSSQGSLSDLENAFKNKSIEKYDIFLEKWSLESCPNNRIDTLSNIHRAVYEIYQDFYNPFDLQRIGSGEFGNELYEGIKYYIIQNFIGIELLNTDSLNFSTFENTSPFLIKKDSIINFRPKLELVQAKALYLYPTYDKIINQFLGHKYYPLGRGGIMNPAKAKGKSAERLNFLNSRLKIIHGHWDGCYHIETHPELFEIQFNKDITLARVNYRLVYQGGYAIYKSENGKWQLQDAKLTWIE